MKLAFLGGAATVTAPVVAPGGTETTSRFGVAEVIAASVPLNATVFCAGVAPKPFPKI